MLCGELAPWLQCLGHLHSLLKAAAPADCPDMSLGNMRALTSLGLSVFMALNPESSQIT